MLVAEDVGGVAIGEGEQHKSWPVFGAHRGYAPTAVCHSDRCHYGVQQCWYLSRWLIAFWYSIVKSTHGHSSANKTRDYLAAFAASKAPAPNGRRVGLLRMRLCHPHCFSLA